RVLALSPAFPHLTPPPPAPALSPLSLHDALPISSLPGWVGRFKELETGADSLVEVTRKLATDVEDEARSEILAWASAVRDSVRSHARDLEGDDFSLVRRLSALASVAEEMVQSMEFQFLFDPSRKIFSIGYRVTEGTLDPSGYDLLASEARLASFVAIAKGDVSPQHWFLLG